MCNYKIVVKYWFIIIYYYICKYIIINKINWDIFCILCIRFFYGKSNKYKDIFWYRLIVVVIYWFVINKL